MELKEGMYVKVLHQIRKIVKIEGTILYFDKSIEYWGEYENWISIDDFNKHEGKAKHNIIDLIEAGDYVNGYKVMEIDEYKPIGCDLQKYLKVDCCKLLNALYQEDIKSIVTKEQFEQMSYKVG